MAGHLCFWFARMRRLCALAALELLGHFGQVHEVPAVADLAPAAVDEGGAGEGDVFSSGRKAEAFAVVDHGAGPADGHFVSLGDKVVDDDMDVAEGIVEDAMDGLEAFRTDEDGVGFGEAVGVALGVKEFVDGRFPALIPDLFKPASCEGLVLL
jgi:hypothetical protein